MNTSSQSNEKDALIQALRDLADSWQQHGNEVSKFIDAEHADDLRATLDRHGFPPSKNLKDDHLKGGA